MSFAANSYAPAGVSSLDFSLQFSRNEPDLKAGAIAYPADLTRVNVSIIETRNTQIDFGLMIGNSYLSLDNDSPNAGLNLNGYHFGLLARSQLGNSPQLGLQAHYLYQRLNDATLTNSVDLDWFEWQLTTNLRFVLGQNWGLAVGAGYTGVDAKRRVTGAINQSLEMSLEEHAHGLIELERLFPNDGRMTITVFSGGQQGLRLGFARRF